jgi:hypothetical protein
MAELADGPVPVGPGEKSLIGTRIPPSGRILDIPSSSNSSGIVNRISYIVGNFLPPKNISHNEPSTWDRKMNSARLPFSWEMRKICPNSDIIPLSPKPGCIVVEETQGK